MRNHVYKSGSGERHLCSTASHRYNFYCWGEGGDDVYMETNVEKFFLGGGGARLQV